MNSSTPPCEIPTASGSCRREFLTCLAGVAALGVVPFAAGFANRRKATARSFAPASAIPSLAEFIPHVGSVFVAAAAGSQNAIPFTLAVAEGLMPRQVGASEPFSLRFAAPVGHLIDSRIYELHHPVLGNLELFISPVGSAVKFGETQNGEALIHPFVLQS